MRFLAVIISSLLFASLAFCQDVNQASIADRREPKLGIFNNGALTQIAQDLFSRSTTNSQVLSLNLTNLVILLVIKALIFGAGHLGLGGLGGHAARSADGNSIEGSDPLISESELMLMMSYLRGDVTQNYSCLHYSACQDPKKTKEYLLAAKMITKGARLFNYGNGEKYEKMLLDVQEAVDYGAKGYDCTTRYFCDAKN